MSEHGHACIEVIEQLCASMRAVGAHGMEHPDAASSIEACRRAIAQAEPPYSLRFLSDSVLRDRTPLVLSLSGFRRAQIIARMLHQLGTADLRIDETPSRETLQKLVRLLVDATQGTHRSFAPKLKGIALRPIAQVDPTSADHDEADVDRVLRGELHGAAELTHALQERMRSARGASWSWSQAQAVITTIERCLALGVTATGRALELAPPEWTPARRAVAVAVHTSIAFSRLRSSDLTRRAATHAILAIACAGLLKHPFDSCARSALDVLGAPPARPPSQPSPHRVRTLALLSAAASSLKPELPVARMMHAVYTLERKRIDDAGQHMSRLDLQAWLAAAIGREVDDSCGRVLLSALGALPPGSHVLSEGRLAVVVGPGADALTPLLLVGGELKKPEQNVVPSSPLGMSPWAK